MKNFLLFFMVLFLFCESSYAQYCPVSLQTPSMGYIRIFSFNGIFNVNNTYDPSGYSDYWGAYVSNPCYQGETYNFQVDGASFWANSSGVTIWIDFNKDGDFADNDERVFRSFAQSNMNVNGTITIPTNAPIGFTRLRVLYSGYWAYYSGFYAENPCCNGCTNGTYGEYEDYRIQIALSLPTITTSTTDTILCADSYSNVSYTVSGTFNSANVFSAQLSDSTGNFSNPITLGGLASQTSGIILCHIPKNILAGTRYRVRVVSSDPVVTGTANSSNIVINKLPTPSISGNNIVCDRSYYSYQTSSFANRIWNWSSKGGVVYQSPTNPNKAIIYWGDIVPDDLPIYDTLRVIETNSLTNCRDSSQFPITIYPRPHLSITGNNTSCENEVVVYSFTTANLSTYKWIASRGTIIGSDANNTVTVKWGTSGTTNGTLKLIGQNQNGCKDTTEIEVIINKLPTPKITGNLICCERSPQIYTSNSNADVTDKWIVENGKFIGDSITKSIIIEWKQKGSGQVSLVQKNSITGCSDTARALINILPKPTANITGSLSVCSSDWGYYTTGSQPGYEYNWKVTGGKVGGVIDQASVFIEWKSTSGRGIITLIKKNSEGCSDTNSINVDIKDKPKAVINGPSMAKINSLISYETTQDDQLEYSWEVLIGGKISGSTNSAKVNVVWEFGPEGKLQLIQKNISTGCTDTSLIIVSITNSSVIINGYTEVCENSEWIYTSELPAGAENKWTANGGSIVGTSLGKSVVVKWGNKGNGILNLLQTIQKDNFKDSASMYITINPVPDKPKITRKGNQLTSSAFLGNQWFLDGIKLLDSTDQFLYPSKNGNYQVNSYEKPCTSELSDVLYVNISDVNDEILDPELIITSIPAEDEFSIYSSISHIRSVQIFDLIGASLFYKESINEFVLNFRCNEIQSGIYYLVIKTDKNIYTRKLIINH